MVASEDSPIDAMCYRRWPSIDFFFINLRRTCVCEFAGIALMRYADPILKHSMHLAQY